MPPKLINALAAVGKNYRKKKQKADSQQRALAYANGTISPTEVIATKKPKNISKTKKK